MLAFPELTPIRELLRLDSSCILPVPPSRPVLTEVPGVAKHISAECLVSEGVLSVGETERVVVIVRIREYHDVLRGALAKEQVVRCLRNTCER